MGVLRLRRYDQLRVSRRLFQVFSAEGSTGLYSGSGDRWRRCWSRLVHQRPATYHYHIGVVGCGGAYGFESLYLVLTFTAWVFVGPRGERVTSPRAAPARWVTRWWYRCRA